MPRLTRGVLAVETYCKMKHGNKKYYFENLKVKGDELIVKTANVYSLKNHLRKYCKENQMDFKETFSVEPISLVNAKITRTA